MAVCPAKTQISLGIRPVWSEPSLCAYWVAKDTSFLHVHSEDSAQTRRMPRLIWVFAGRTATLLVLSWGSSNNEQKQCKSVNIRDEFHFSDICQNECSGSRAKLMWHPTGVTYFTRDPLHSYFDYCQKNKIYYLIKYFPLSGTWAVWEGRFPGWEVWWLWDPYKTVWGYWESGEDTEIPTTVCW